MRSAILLLLCCCLAACPKQNIVKEPPDYNSGEPDVLVPSVYKPFFSGLLSHDDIATVRAGLPFDSISLRRTPCYGTCPVYEVVLHRDGRATLNAEAHLPKLGKFVGEVNIETYGRLCYLIEASHFNDLKPTYSGGWTDDATCIVTVTTGTTSKAVSDYGSVGPIELWAIQQLLDATRNEIKWKSIQ